MPRRPRHELAVALAGPAVNFVLAAALWVVAPVLAGSELLASFVGSVMLANLGLGIFNLLPAFPMDGGRALRALLAERVGSYRATETAAKVGKALALVMGVVGVVWGPVMLVLVAGFVWLAANAEQQASRAEAYLGGRSWRGPGARVHADEVEVLDAPRRRRSWADLFVDSRPAYPSRARRVAEAAQPVRVILVRRGWF
jgi:hypothetical protein